MFGLVHKFYVFFFIQEVSYDISNNKLCPTNFYFKHLNSLNIKIIYYLFRFIRTHLLVNF